MMKGRGEGTLAKKVDSNGRGDDMETKGREIMTKGKEDRVMERSWSWAREG